MTESQSTFRSHHATLFRRSIVPASPIASLAIIHGYGDHSGRFVHFMRWLAERDVASHAVDLRGQGRSTGRHGYVQDWRDYLIDLLFFLGQPDVKNAPLFVLGHSHGGLVLASAGVESLIDRVRGCIFTSPFLKSRLKVPAYKLHLARLLKPVFPWLPIPSGLSHDMMSSDPRMIADSRADPFIRRVATPGWFAGMIEAQQTVLSRAEWFKTPFLLLTGTADPIADAAASVGFYNRAGATDKTYKSYPNLLHELLRERAREMVFNDVLNWIKARA